MKFATLVLVASVSALQLDLAVDTEIEKTKQNKNAHNGHGCITLEQSDKMFDGAMKEGKGKMELEDVVKHVFAWSKKQHHWVPDEIWMWMGWRTS